MPARSGWRPRSACCAWVVDDTGIAKDGQALAGGEASVLGHVGQDRQLPDHGLVHAVGERGTLPLGWPLYLPEEWCADERAAGARRRSRRRSRSRRSRSLAGGLIEQAAAWQIPAAPILADCAYGDDSALPHAAARAGARVRARRLARRSSVYGPETTFAVPERNGSIGRPRTVARPDRKPESVRALAERLPSARLDRRCPAGRRRRARRSRAASPSSASSPPTRSATDHQPPRWEWLIIEWPEDAEAPSDYWLSNLADDGEPRAARAARAAALDDRARLPAAERRARPRPLRRPQLPRLPPPRRARHLRARLPHARTARPKSPAAGLTLPQTVLLLQPVLRCWAGRCRTCQQPVDLDQLAPLPPTGVTKQY